MGRVKAIMAALTVGIVLGGCASAPAPITAPQLLHDELFAPPSQAPDVAGLFALSDAMRAYAGNELAALARRQDPRRALIEALYSKSQLRLSYDASNTLNAAQAFEARVGNCLSLVIMTAAFAKELGLPVSYEAVLSEDYFSRSGGLYLASGHVNLVLGQSRSRTAFSRSDRETLTIDFLSQEELRGQRSRALDEQTIVAMYLNNRAAETLAAGRVTDAYWFAREALLQDPGFFSAANTLGVIYNWAGHDGPAESAFRRVLEGEPNNVSALSNLVRLLQRQGRGDESAALAAQLQRLQPVPPFHHFNLGRAAMDAGDFERALEHFERELRLQPYQDEVHFWAAQAYWSLGQPERAARHLRQAAEFSNTQREHDRYQAKLEHLRQSQLH